MARLNINGVTHDVNVAPDTPLLWVIREQVGLGQRCREDQCKKQAKAITTEDAEEMQDTERKL